MPSCSAPTTKLTLSKARAQSSPPSCIDLFPPNTCNNPNSYYPHKVARHIAASVHTSWKHTTKAKQNMLNSYFLMIRLDLAWLDLTWLMMHRERSLHYKNFYLVPKPFQKCFSSDSYCIVNDATTLLSFNIVSYSVSV